MSLAPQIGQMKLGKVEVVIENNTDKVIENDTDKKDKDSKKKEKE